MLPISSNGEVSKTTAIDCLLKEISSYRLLYHNGLGGTGPVNTNVMVHIEKFCFSHKPKEDNISFQLEVQAVPVMPGGTYKITLSHQRLG